MPPLSEKGLRHHLDTTRESHNDKGYDEFVALEETEGPYQGKIRVSRVVREFNVNKKTALKWIRVYIEEEMHDERGY